MSKDYKTQYEKVKGLFWDEFVWLDEVASDESPSGEGQALYYNDKIVQVSVDHNHKTMEEVLADKELAEELQELALEAMLEELSWETE